MIKRNMKNLLITMEVILPDPIFSTSEMKITNAVQVHILGVKTESGFP